MEDNEHIILIVKHLNRETSHEEEKYLQEWLETNPQHRIEYESVKKLWTVGSDAAVHRNYDTKAAWTKVDTALAHRPSHHHLRRLIRTLAAASVLLIVGAGWWFYYQHRSPSLLQKLAAEDVSTLTLPDSSLVWLRKGAKLEYPPVFDKDVREVKLTGEAFFLPAPDASHPFRIITANVIVEDIGTSFLVNDKEPEGEIVVQTGKVKLTSKNDHAEQMILSPGEKATIRSNKLSLSRQGSPNYDSWKTGLLEFKQTPLTQVVEDINDHYRSSVSITPELRAAAADIKVTARFDHQPLRQAVDEIRLATGLRTIQEKDTLFFAGQ